MRIGDYVLPVGPSPGGRLVTRVPRASVESSLTGVVGHSHAGHPGDELVVRQFGPVMDASPAIAVVRSSADVSAAGDTLNAGERLAFRIPVAAFAAISAARIWLAQNGAAAGHLTIEIWDTVVATGLPNEKLGTIGYVDCDDITNAPAYNAHETFADAAYPCGLVAVPGAWLVISAAEMTAGIVTWGGTATAAAPPIEHAKYTVGVWTGFQGELSGTVWQGGPFCVLRGLVAAANGGREYEVDLDDGQLYTALLLDLDAMVVVRPTALGGAILTSPASAGVAANIRLTMGIVSELNS